MLEVPRLRAERVRRCLACQDVIPGGRRKSRDGWLTGHLRPPCLFSLSQSSGGKDICRHECGPKSEDGRVQPVDGKSTRSECDRQFSADNLNRMQGEYARSAAAARETIRTVRKAGRRSRIQADLRGCHALSPLHPTVAASSPPLLLRRREMVKAPNRQQRLASWFAQAALS